MICACGCSAASRCTSRPRIGLFTPPNRYRPRGVARPGQPGRLVLQALHRRQQHPGPGEHQLAQRGGPGAAPVPFEQRAAQRPLDALELGGERRLGQAERRGRLGHAPRLGDRADHPQVSQLQVHRVTVGPRRAAGGRRAGRIGEVNRCLVCGVAAGQLAAAGSGPGRPGTSRRRVTASRTLSTTPDRRLDDPVPRRGGRGARVRPGRGRLLGDLQPVAQPDQLLRRWPPRAASATSAPTRVDVPADPLGDVGQPGRPAGQSPSARSAARRPPRSPRSTRSAASGSAARAAGQQVLLLGGQVPRQRGGEHRRHLRRRSGVRAGQPGPASASSCRCSRSTMSAMLRPPGR